MTSAKTCSRPRRRTATPPPMGGVNRADGRFFVHDTLAEGLVQDAREPNTEMNARMRQRMTNLERREKSLVTMVARAAAGRAGGAPCAASRHRRSARRGGGSSTRSPTTSDGQPPIDGRPSEVGRRACREQPDAEASLRRTVAELAALERRLRSPAGDRACQAHQANVSQLEAEIEAQGTRLAERNLENRELTVGSRRCAASARARFATGSRGCPVAGPARPPPASRPGRRERAWTRIALAADRVRLCDRRSAAL